MSRLAWALPLLLWCGRAHAEPPAAPKLDRAPALTHFVEAVPPDTLAEHERVEVILTIDVDDHGKVQSVAVATPSPFPAEGYDEAAVAAAKQFEFTPGQSAGKPVPVRITYAYRFLYKAPPPPLAPAVPPEEKVPLGGVVKSKGDRVPLGGVTIILDDDEARKTVTDAEGRFAFPAVPIGPHKAKLRGTSITNADLKLTLSSNKRLEVVWYVAAKTRYTSTVRGQRVVQETVEISLSGDELRRIPGTQGDTLKAVQNLPGVARAPFNTGLIIVRGGRPTDSRVYIGGSEVPQLYHFGGLTSVVPTQVIDSIDFFAGNFGVRYGRAIAGTIDADLREGKRDRWHGAAETNVFDTGLSAEGPVGKGSLLLAARRSYVDALLSAVAAPGLKFTDAPVYYDYQAVFDYPVGGGHLRVMALGSDDVLKLIFDRPQDADPALTSFGTHIFFHKLQVRWTRAVGNWNFFTQLAGGYQGSSGALGSTLSYGVGVGGLDARLEGRYQWSRKLKFLIGADVVYSNVALDLDVPPPTREGQTPSPISAGETQHLHTPINLGEIGLFAEATWKPNGRVSITPGLRFDYYSVLQHPTVNPRLSAQFRLAGFTWLKAGVGLYSQPPQPTDYVAQFGSPTVRPESALHTALTLEQGLAPGLIVEATGFYKQLYDLAATSGKFVERGGQVVPERVASIGEGRVYGLEVLLRQSISKWFFGLVSYTLMKSERKDCSTCGWRQFDFDQTHVLVIVAHAYLPRGFELGLRFRYITGFPYTPPSGGYYDADSDVYSPAHGPVNTARLADFNAIDFRIDKTFLFKRWLLKLYLDVSNVYNRANQEVIQPSYDFVRSAPITGLPILPSFGIRGEF